MATLYDFLDKLALDMRDNFPLLEREAVLLVSDSVFRQLHERSWRVRYGQPVAKTHEMKICSLTIKRHSEAA